MTLVAIDQTKGVRKSVLLTHEDVEDIGAYRRAQRKIPNESQAIADLIRLGLEKWREEQDDPGRGGQGNR